jgi:16S rRNA (guanine966-N2)-methyltransferase
VRIIAGTLRGRKLSPVQGQRIRPSSDYLRESIFNILKGTVEEAVVLDLYAGTGSLGLEALSRGATFAVFVDNHPQSIKILERNVVNCSLEDRSAILKRDVLLRGLGFLRATQRVFDLVFADPPYAKGFAERTVALLDNCPYISKGARIVVEHSIAESLPEKGTRLERTGQRQYGKALVSFYESVL